MVLHTLPKKKKGKLLQLLHELSSDEENSLEEGDHALDPQSPWLKEFNLYLHSSASVPEGLSIVQWWGVRKLSCMHFQSTNRFVR